MKKYFHLTLLLLLSCSTVYGTHLKGGYITYKHLNGLTYEITITAYADTDSPVLFGSNGTIDFGDGTTEQLLNNGSDDNWISRQRISDESWKYELSRVHTFPGQNSYTISFQELYRNEGILNIDNSEDTPFFVETTLFVDNIRGSSARPLQDPAFTAYLHQTYHYNPNAYDVDGDSLSYRLAPVKQDKENIAAGYTHPHLVYSKENGSETGESVYFTINPITGDFIWDSPVKVGEYTVAIEIQEWRKIAGEYMNNGTVLLDFLIVVKDKEEIENELELKFPLETKAIQLEKDVPFEVTIQAKASNPEDTVVLRLLGDFPKRFPEALQSDSIGAKGEASLSLQYTPGESANETYQLIARADIYSKEELREGRPHRARSAYLLAPGFVNGFKDAPVTAVKLFPNPSFSNSFFINAPLLDGKEVMVSLFSPDGRMLFHKSYKTFYSREAIKPHISLSGFYLVLVRQDAQLYTSRILFSR